MLLGIMVACKKESSTTPTTTPTETAIAKAQKILMSGDWVVEAMYMSTAGGPMIPIPMEDCEKDDYAKFTTSKQIIFSGIEKCDPEEMSSDTMDYLFNTKADSITFSYTDMPITYGFSSPTSTQIILNMSTPEFKQKLVLKRK